MAPSDETLFIATTPGLEPALELECRALGFHPVAEPGGVTVSGPRGLHRELNLRARTASRVLLRVAEVGVGNIDRVALAPFIPKGAPTEVSATVLKSRVRADRVEELARQSWKLQKPPRRTSDADEEVDAFRVLLRVDGDVCTVSVDTSGDLLYRRGYRQEVSHAPLRETLAAGLLVLAGYDGSEPVTDPMCGSGTIAIEAALIAQHRAPGMDRSFAFERFPSFDDAARRAFDDLKDLLRSKETRPAFKIRATDIHSGALGAARRNGKRAGVSDILELERQDVAKAELSKGFVISNPPYGKRVGDKQDLDALYSALGSALGKARGVRFGLLVADEALEKKLHLPIEAAHRVQNGGIWCRYLVGRSPA